MSINNTTGLVLLILWLAGIVLSKGFWWTLLAIVMPPWSIYILVERAMAMANII